MGENQEKAEKFLCDLDCPYNSGQKLGDKILCWGHYGPPRTECVFYDEYQKNRQPKKTDETAEHCPASSSFNSPFSSPEK